VNGTARPKLNTVLNLNVPDLSDSEDEDDSSPDDPESIRPQWEAHRRAIYANKNGVLWHTGWHLKSIREHFSQIHQRIHILRMDALGKAATEK
jgi:hypothetical protein